jgi:hypothetical protein
MADDPKNLKIHRVWAAEGWGVESNRGVPQGLPSCKLWFAFLATVLLIFVFCSNIDGPRETAGRHVFAIAVAHGAWGKQNAALPFWRRHQ